ncbi:MAG: leucine-rich repeat domain-containing protein, partial [Lachnospiraceae bacterium]|nr:leucine-rich repeat domain-containing protein [Lachnospiraceae bacterium]
MWGKKRGCQVFVFVFLVVLLAAARPVAAKAQQGKCGPKAKWSYNKKTKTVTISGKGAVTKMIQVKVSNTKVKKIVVKEGITNLEKLAINVKDIYSNEAYKDYKLQLVLPDSLKRIGWIGSDIVKGLAARGDFDMSKSTLTIPKNVSKINSVALANTRPRKVVVNPENKSFVCKDGVLFSKDMKTLVYYPPEKKQKTYKIPASVRKIKALSFYGNRHLKKVVLPKQLKVIGSGAFCGCRKLSSVNLHQTKIKKLTDYAFFHEWGYNGSFILDAEDSSMLMEEREELNKQLNLYKRSMPEYFGTFEGTSLQSIKLPDTLVYASSNTFLLDYVNDTSKKSPIALHLGKRFTGEVNSDTKGYQGEKSLNLSGVSVAVVTVDPANTKYCVKNQALYSKDGKTLYQHFVSDSRKTYIIDAGTKRIAPGAFTWGDGIVNLIVEGSLDNIGYCAFSEFFEFPGDFEYPDHGERKHSLQHVKVQG